MITRKPMHPAWAYTIVAIGALIVLGPSILALLAGDTFYALVEWPATLALAFCACDAGRRAYAWIEFKIRRKLLGWRQGPGSMRMLAIARRRTHPAWFAIGLISYPTMVAWNAVREVPHGGWWPPFAGLATAALLLLLSHWEFNAEREAAGPVTDEVERRLNP